MRNQLLPWFGSKAALAAEILPEFGPHKAYFEPFGGGMAMLLHKTPCHAETVNDLHQDLTHLARIVANPAQGAALYRRLRRTLCCEQLHREARERIKQPFAPTLDRAVDFFFVSWASKQGVCGAESSNSMAHGYGVASHPCAAKLRGAVESIRAWQARMRGVTITNRDAFELLAKLHDDEGLLIYCDPPYIQKNGRYLFDLDDSGHQRLADSLQRFTRARVIVSYTDHPRLAELYPAGAWTKKVLNYKARANRGAKTPTVKPPEVLLIKGPQLAA